MVFRRTPRAGRPAPHRPVVGVDAGRVAGGTRRARARRSAAALEHPVVHIAYEDAARLRRVGGRARCRPRPSGSSPPAAGSTARPTPGATSPSRRASGSPTTGTATSPGAPSPATGRPRRSARSRPTATGSSTWPATSGSGRATGTAAAEQAAPATPRQPQFADPAQGRQGRLVPVRRQLLPALPARRAAAADDRHRHEPHRLPLRAGRMTHRRVWPDVRPPERPFGHQVVQPAADDGDRAPARASSRPPSPGPRRARRRAAPRRDRAEDRRAARRRRALPTRRRPRRCTARPTASAAPAARTASAASCCASSPAAPGRPAPRSSTTASTSSPRARGRFRSAAPSTIPSSRTS